MHQYVLMIHGIVLKLYTTCFNSMCRQQKVSTLSKKYELLGLSFKTSIIHKNNLLYM